MSAVPSECNFDHEKDQSWKRFKWNYIKRIEDNSNTQRLIHINIPLMLHAIGKEQTTFLSDVKTTNWKLSYVKSLCFFVPRIFNPSCDFNQTVKPFSGKATCIRGLYSSQHPWLNVSHHSLSSIFGVSVCER